MKNLSLKLDEPIFEETEKLLSDLHVSRNRYINEALAYYNRLMSRKLLGRQLKGESALVAKDSMAILHEFEDLDDEAI